jgi:hypothetical protein
MVLPPGKETGQIPESSPWYPDNDDDPFEGYDPIDDIFKQHPEEDIHINKNPTYDQQEPRHVQSGQRRHIPRSFSSSSSSESSSANSLLSSSKKSKTPAKKKGKKVRWASNVKKSSSSESSASAAEKKPPKLETTPEPSPPPAAPPPEPEPVKTPTPEPAVAGRKWPIPYIAFGCVVTIFIVAVYAIFVARTRSKSKRKRSGPPPNDEMQTSILASGQNPVYPDPPSYASVTASESSFPVYIPSPAVSIVTEKQ